MQLGIPRAFTRSLHRLQPLPRELSYECAETGSHTGLETRSTRATALASQQTLHGLRYACWRPEFFAETTRV